jgi:cyclase
MGWGVLKKRVIPVLLLSNGRMVKGKQFNNYQDTGDPQSAVRIYNHQYADEIFFIDIERGPNDKKFLLEIMSKAASESFMPFTAGGGVSDTDDIRNLLLAGADKVLINSASIAKPGLINKAAIKFGSQCIVAGIDYRTMDERSSVWVECGRVETKIDPVDHARFLSDQGAGEILLNSIDRDGMMNGYDLEMANKVADAVSIPVIICGGAGNFSHLEAAMKGTSIAGVACASLFHFGDNNPMRARSYLRNQGLPVRAIK